MNKTVIKNVAFILSNVTRKIPESITVNYLKNVGVVTTVSKTSKNRKTGSNATFTHTTEQSATTFTKVLNLDVLSVVLLWFPIIEEILSRQAKIGSRLIIALDRTQWKENNVLMVSVIYQKRALPIFWVLLEKDGSSNFREQQKVLRPVFRLLNQYKLVVIGDREFHSIELASWLHRQNISFVFRQKKDTTFRQKRQKFQPLNSIPIHPGIKQFYTDINLLLKNEDLVGLI